LIKSSTLADVGFVLISAILNSYLADIDFALFLPGRHKMAWNGFLLSAPKSLIKITNISSGLQHSISKP